MTVEGTNLTEVTFGQLSEVVKRGALLVISCRRCGADSFYGVANTGSLNRVLHEPECDSCESDCLYVDQCEDADPMSEREMRDVASKFIGLTDDDLRDFILMIEDPSDGNGYHIQERRLNPDETLVTVQTERTNYHFEVVEHNGPQGPTGTVSDCWLEETTTEQMWEVEKDDLPKDLDEVGEQLAARWWRSYGGDQ